MSGFHILQLHLSFSSPGVFLIISAFIANKRVNPPADDSEIARVEGFLYIPGRNCKTKATSAPPNTFAQYLSCATAGQDNTPSLGCLNELDMRNAGVDTTKLRSYTSGSIIGDIAKNL